MTSIPEEPVQPDESVQDKSVQEETTQAEVAPDEIAQEPLVLEVSSLIGEIGEDSPEAFAGDPSRRYDMVAYLLLAAVFFGLGFMVAAVIGVDLGGSSSLSAQMEINQAVLGTMIALTPTPLPEPTRPAVENTFSSLDYSLGPVDAPVTIVEFSDYQCPYCARFANDTLIPLLEKYNGYVRFVYRDYVIFGDPSIKASLAARCSNEQGQFWAYHDELFFRQHLGEERQYVDDAMLTSIATDLIMDIDGFAACMNDEQQLEILNSNIYNAYVTVGQAGTPTFLINGRRIEGSLPLDSFSYLIDQELIALGIDPPG